jgi:hypothetical protein
MNAFSTRHARCSVRTKSPLNLASSFKIRTSTTSSSGTAPLPRWSVIASGLCAACTTACSPRKPSVRRGSPCPEAEPPGSPWPRARNSTKRRSICSSVDTSSCGENRPSLGDVAAHTTSMATRVSSLTGPRARRCVQPDDRRCIAASHWRDSVSETSAAEPPKARRPSGRLRRSRPHRECPVCQTDPGPRARGSSRDSPSVRTWRGSLRAVRPVVEQAGSP